MPVRIGPFRGMVPKIAPRFLHKFAAQSAINCKFYAGGLRAWKSPSTVTTPTKAGTKLSLFYYADTYWFHWITDVDVVKSPVAEDSFERVYFTGDGAPKMTANDVAVTGGTNYPVNSYLLGVPVPESTPTLSVGGAATDPDPTLVETRAYVYTYVSYYGEEGPPCTASLTADVSPGQTVTISGMSTGPAGSYRVTAKRIYRTNTGSSNTSYQFVAEVSVATVSYEDSTLSADLGEVIPSVDWDGPPDDLTCLRVLPNGSLAGISGNTLCFSVPYQPHAWPVSYQIPFPYDLVAIDVFGMSVLVTTQGPPYIVTGSTMGSLTTQMIEDGSACVSKRGMVNMGDFVFYPAPDGLIMVGSGGVNNITDDVLSRENWQAYKPDSIVAFDYYGKYIGFYNTGSVTAGFVYDPVTKDFAQTTVYATAGYNDPVTGRLYLQVGNDICLWDGGAALSLTWKSKPFYSKSGINFSAARVYAPSYPVTVKFYRDGNLVSTKTVTSSNSFRLPTGLYSYLEIEANSEVDYILCGTSMSDLK